MRIVLTKGNLLLVPVTGQPLSTVQTAPVRPHASHPYQPENRHVILASTVCSAGPFQQTIQRIPMAKRYTLRTVLTLLSIPALAGLMGVSYAQALAPADSTRQPPDQPAIRQQTMPPASGIVVSAFRHTNSLAGGVVQGGRLLRMTRPSYPSTAKRAFVSGVVTVEALIGKDGHIVETSVLRGPYPLRQVAEHAVKRWRYEPTLLDGKPVERVAEVNFSFVLGRR